MTLTIFSSPFMIPGVISNVPEEQQHLHTKSFTFSCLRGQYFTFLFSKHLLGIIGNEISDHQMTTVFLSFESLVLAFVLHKLGLVRKSKYFNLFDTIEDRMRMEMSTVCQVRGQW